MIRSEKRKLEKEIGKLQHELKGIRIAAKALGRSTGKEVRKMKLVLSAAGRAKIAAAARRRWANVRSQGRKAVR
jgi:hypothetical protein